MSALAATEHLEQTNCGPLSWKQENNIKINHEEIEPIYLVRHCKPACWAYGHNILRSCNGKIKDIVVDRHICYGENEIITGYWNYLIISYYNDDNQLQPCHVTVYIDGEQNIKGDITDYVLRNPSCIRKKDFVDRDSIDQLKYFKK